MAEYTYPGNLIPLLSANQSHQSNGLAWSVTNATLDQVTGTTVWFGVGQFYAAKVTPSGAGEIVFTQDADVNTYAPVTPGERYLGAIWCVFTTQTNLTIELLWTDDSYTPVGTPASRSFTTSPTPASRRPSVEGVAPEGAALVTLRLKWSATGSGDTAFFSTAFLGISSTAGYPNNILTWDEWSAEGPSSLDHWQATGATLSLDDTAVIQSTTYDDGTTLVRADVTDSRIVWWLDRLVPATEGETYEYRSVVSLNQQGDPNQFIWLRTKLEWRAADESHLVTLESQWRKTEQIGEWIANSLTLTGQAPPGATSALLVTEVDTVDSTATAYHFDHMSFREATPTHTIEVHPEDSYVSLEIFPEDAITTDHITVWRVHEDGTQVPVRSYDGDVVGLPLANTESMSLEDYEAPIGEKIWYRIIRYEEGGLGRVEIPTTSVRAPGIKNADYAWFKSPGLPALNVQAIVESPPVWQREARSTLYSIVGRRNPISISAVRAGRSTTLSLLTWTEGEASALEQLLELGTSVLLQAAPGLGIAGNLYTSVGDVVVEPLSYHAPDEGRRWTLEITEIDRPSGPLSGSRSGIWEWVSLAKTWAEIADSYDDWAAVLRDPYLGV